MKVYMVQRNSDFEEGRGHMIDDKCFLNREHAVEYMDSKTGVAGRKYKWSLSTHSDWQIKTIDVIEHRIN